MTFDLSAQVGWQSDKPYFIGGGDHGLLISVRRVDKRELAGKKASWTQWEREREREREQAVSHSYIQKTQYKLATHDSEDIGQAWLTDRN